MSSQAFSCYHSNRHGNAAAKRRLLTGINLREKMTNCLLRHIVPLIGVAVIFTTSLTSSATPVVVDINFGSPLDTPVPGTWHILESNVPEPTAVGVFGVATMID
jgi:hypothetical protein